MKCSRFLVELTRFFGRRKLFVHTRFLWILFFFDCFFITVPLDVRAQKAVWILPGEHLSIDSLENLLFHQHLDVRTKSSWLNAVSVDVRKHFDLSKFCTENNCRYQPVLALKKTTLGFVSSMKLEEAIEQMNGIAFLRDGLTGRGVKVGMADAGYMYLNDSLRMKELTHLWKNNQIISTHDFVNNLDTISYDELYYTRRKSVYKERKNWIRQLRRDLKLVYHSHGTEVLKLIAGLDSGTSTQFGLAPLASYYLARTEDGVKEFKAEEDYYIAALEWLHGQGVRIVNTSLGYGRGRKIKGSNYTPLQMNGTTMISKAVQIACTEKNMLVVVAAGNDGAKSSWKVISTPADAEAALTVGAVLSRFQKAGYSGVGPEYNRYLKPDVCAYSNQGTSLSAPAVCGFAACLLEADPSLTAVELKKLIVRSAHLYPYGNNSIGYGVPLANRALQLIVHPEVHFGNTKEVHVTGTSFQLDSVDASIPTITIFHKKNEVHVIKQEVKSRAQKSNSFIIQPPKNTKRSTVQIGYEILELFWE